MDTLSRSSSGKLGSSTVAQTKTSEKIQPQIKEAVFQARIRTGPNKPKERSVTVRVESDHLHYTTTNPTKPKATLKTVSLPLVLVWVKDIAALSLEIFAPEHSLSIFCEDEQQKQSWETALHFRIAQSIYRYKAGDALFRSNYYTFENAKGWEYEGEWKEARMFGRGRLGFKVGTPQQIIYNGYFNFYAGVGFGVKVVQKSKAYKDNIGWEFQSPFDGHIREFTYHGLNGVYLEDLEEVKKRSQIKCYEKGESILSRGINSEEEFFLIKSGVGEYLGTVLTTIGNRIAFNAKATEDTEVWHLPFALLEKDFANDGYFPPILTCVHEDSLLLRLLHHIVQILGARWASLQHLRKEVKPDPPAPEEGPLRLNRSVRAGFFVRREAFNKKDFDASSEEDPPPPPRELHRKKSEERRGTIDRELISSGGVPLPKRPTEDKLENAHLRGSKKPQLTRHRDTNKKLEMPLEKPEKMPRRPSDKKSRSNDGLVTIPDDPPTSPHPVPPEPSDPVADRPSKDKQKKEKQLGASRLNTPNSDHIEPLPTLPRDPQPQPNGEGEPKNSLRSAPMKALKSLWGSGSTPMNSGSIYSSPRSARDDLLPQLSPRVEASLFRRSLSVSEPSTEECPLEGTRRNTPPALKDKKTLTTFGFSEDTPILQRHHCWVAISGSSTSMRTELWGILYLLTKSVCFMPEDEEKKSFIIIPVATLEEHSVKHNEKEVIIKTRKTVEVILPSRNSGVVKIQLLFNSPEEALKFFEYLRCLTVQTHDPGLHSSEYSAELEQTFSSRVSSLPLLAQHNLKSYKMLKLRDLGIRLSGPGALQAEPENQAGKFSRELGNHVAVTITTTYPRVFDQIDGKIQLRNDLRLGDPICDQFCLERYDNATLFAVADGCNWGDKVARAAESASRTFVEWARQALFKSEKTHQLYPAFVEAFTQAHFSILQGSPSKNWDDTGTTTLLGGALCQVKHKIKKWALLLLNLGDCKAYRISTKDNTFAVEDLTLGSRKEALLSCNDCGGRLGSYSASGNLPDLRNLTAYHSFLDEGDFVLTCSDGVYDNLDPQSLGLSFTELDATELQDFTWSTLPTDDKTANVVAEIKHKFTVNKIAEILTAQTQKLKQEPNELCPGQIRDAIVEHCFLTTKNCREWMESNHNNVQPPQTKEYAGKPDHVTCMVIRACNSEKLIDDTREPFMRTIKSLNDPITGINKTSCFRHLVEGHELLKWVGANKHEQLSALRSSEIAQRLLDYSFIVPVSSPFVHESYSFSKDAMYHYQAGEYITQKDWKFLEAGSRTIKQKLGAPLFATLEEHSKPKFWRLKSGKCKITLENGVTKPCDAPETFITFGKQIGLVAPPTILKSVICDSPDMELSEYDDEFLETLFYKHPDVGTRFYREVGTFLTFCIVQLIQEL